MRSDDGAFPALIRIAVAAVSVGLLLPGCSVMKQRSEASEQMVEQGERKIVSIQQSETQRDIITGERRFVFCEGKDCQQSTAKTTPVRARPAPVPARPVAQAERAKEAEKESVRTFQIGFDYDRSTLNAEGLKVLESASAFASEKNAQEIRIHGKADSYDRDAYNLKLAERRARTVERFLKGKQLAAKLIVDASVVRVSADGEHPPGEAFKGRRVDLDIVIEIVSANKQVP